MIFPCTQALESWLIECITDQHGNHVVQKAVEIIGQSNLNIILGHCLGKVKQRRHSHGEICQQHLLLLVHPVQPVEVDTSRGIYNF